MKTQKHFSQFAKFSTVTEPIQERIERFNSPVATKIGHSKKRVDSAVGEAGSGVEGDDIAEDDFGGREASFVFELVENLLHFVEHFGSAKLGDDEVVGDEGVAERLCLSGISVRVRVRVWVLEEVESKVWVLLEAKERGEPEGRDGFYLYRFHFLGF